jgi:GntP family gluconate:H+ symporter
LTTGPVGGRDFVDRDDIADPVSPGRSVDEQLGPRRDPGFAADVLTILLPVLLMLARGGAELVLPEGDAVRDVLEVLGEPVVALLAGVLVAMWALGKRAGFDRRETNAVLGGALPPIAGILLIVAAGGGFKQVLVDAGVGNVIADAARDANINALVLGFLVAVGIRVATGSATVATITAAGIVAPLATTLDRPEVSLLALAIGAGSLFFSHVNDAGFWMVKEYFGMTVGQTIKTWSVMETIISVVGFACVMLLSLFL